MNTKPRQKRIRIIVVAYNACSFAYQFVHEHRPSPTTPEWVHGGIEFDTDQ
jgi:hypothetical protein